MVSFAVLIDIFVGHLLSGDLFDQIKRFQNRDGVIATTAQVVNLRNPRCLDELIHELRDVERMDIVANLFAFIAEHLIGSALEITPDQVAEETV